MNDRAVWLTVCGVLVIASVAVPAPVTAADGPQLQVPPPITEVASCVEGRMLFDPLDDESTLDDPTKPDNGSKVPRRLPNCGIRICFYKTEGCEPFSMSYQCPDVEGYCKAGIYRLYCWGNPTWQGDTNAPCEIYEAWQCNPEGQCDGYGFTCF